MTRIIIWLATLCATMKMRRIARRRWKKGAKVDPTWQESWWVLRRRYDTLARRYTRLEMKYLSAKDRLRRFDEPESNGKRIGDNK